MISTANPKLDRAMKPVFDSQFRPDPTARGNHPGAEFGSTMVKRTRFESVSTRLAAMCLGNLTNGEQPESKARAIGPGLVRAAAVQRHDQLLDFVDADAVRRRVLLCRETDCSSITRQLDDRQLVDESMFGGIGDQVPQCLADARSIEITFKVSESPCGSPLPCSQKFRSPAPRPPRACDG